VYAICHVFDATDGDAQCLNCHGFDIMLGGTVLALQVEYASGVATSHWVGLGYLNVARPDSVWTRRHTHGHQAGLSSSSPFGVSPAGRAAVLLHRSAI
jgi:hypothetical protein